MSDSRSTENADADTVDRAVEALQRRDSAQARRLLEQVIANAPARYAYSFEEDGKLHVKFWSLDEFLGYVSQPEIRDGGREIIWLKSAYPRACYYLAYLEVEAGNVQHALELLHAALRLEPDQTVCICELALIHGKLGKHAEALGLYEQALKLRPWLPAKSRAVAMRGKGCQLIDLGRLDDAEACFHDSLKLDPESTVAHNELQYIAQLRRTGGKSGPGAVTATSGGLNVCHVCGETLDVQASSQAQMLTVGGMLRYVCRKCAQSAPAKELESGNAGGGNGGGTGRDGLVNPWWKFWK